MEVDRYAFLREKIWHWMNLQSSLCVKEDEVCFMPKLFFNLSHLQNRASRQSDRDWKRAILSKTYRSSCHGAAPAPR